jgi:molybdate transport system regulatory protein
MATRLTIRLDFDASRRLGPGKVALLESIGQTGSISAAGRAHAMSYRKAWLLVEEMNRMFARPLVAARPGGVKGGGAELTPAGVKVVALYRAAERKMRAGAKTEIARMERALAAIG